MAFNWMGLLAQPKDEERLDALRRRRAALPPELRTPDQAVGRYVVGCGATHGIYERCNFGCTACYLSTAANREEALPFEEVQAQLQALRGYLGPGGNVQITSGEVTLLPREALARIIACAVDLDLSPMVMTHGDVLLQRPDYLDHLVVEGGLRKISLHVDITQRGRRGVARADSEAALNTVRDDLADLLRACRRRTGIKLKAATTLTVSRDNLDQIGDVLDWTVANLDAFRILSFQPQADVGRTRHGGGVNAEEVWRCLEWRLGKALNPHPVRFGHAACNRMALLIALDRGRDLIVLEAVRKESAMDRAFMDRALADFAGLVLSGRSTPVVLAKVLAVLLRKPAWWLRLPLYAWRRTWQERRLLAGTVAAACLGRLRIRPFALVVHSFMGREQMATQEGRERLAACVFRLPVNGRMVSMCELNAGGLRESQYRHHRPEKRPKTVAVS